jgi:endogenous inhibitor of DNA gyrase (YacG/DUF329 family)
MTDPITRTEDTINMPCLNCGKPVEVDIDSYEANGVFNVFCSGDCEDRYAWKQ